MSFFLPHYLVGVAGADAHTHTHTRWIVFSESYCAVSNSQQARVPVKLRSSADELWLKRLKPKTCSVCVHFQSLGGSHTHYNAHYTAYGVSPCMRLISWKTRAHLWPRWPFPSARRITSPRSRCRTSTQNIWKTLTSFKWIGGSGCLGFCCSNFVVMWHSKKNITGPIPDGGGKHISCTDVTFAKRGASEAVYQRGMTYSTASQFVYYSLMALCVSGRVTCQTFSSLHVITVSQSIFFFP